MERKTFGSILLAVTLALSGCTDNPKSPPNAPPTAKTASPQTAPTTTSPEIESSYPEIKSYYPELTGYPILSTGEFSSARTHTKWLNLSRMNFNPNRAATIFNFFEDLGRSQKLINYSANNQQLPFYLGQKPRTERVIFIIPQEAPPPSWPDTAYDASTTGKFIGGPYATFVRMPNSERDIPPSLVFTTAEAAANKAFAVEACQSSLQVSSLSPEVADLGQEIVCNSWGVAFTLRQNSMPFAEYEAWAKTVLIRKDPNSPGFPLYVPSAAEYDRIPNIGSVFSKK